MQPKLKNLVDLVAAGDPLAFRELFDRFAGKVHAFALKLTHNDTMAEEIVQEVFLKIWLHREGLSAIDYFPSYLYTITRNHTFNVLKHLAHEAHAKQALGKVLVKTHEETEEAVIYEDYQRLLDRVIDRLPPKQRQVYSLCHQQGLKYEEVAHRLNISRLTVKTHMQQALRTIKTHFSSTLGLWLVSLVSWFD